MFVHVKLDGIDVSNNVDVVVFPIICRTCELIWYRFTALYLIMLVLYFIY